jgi:hypothetical protein
MAPAFKKLKENMQSVYKTEEHLSRVKQSKELGIDLNEKTIAGLSDDCDTFVLRSSFLPLMSANLFIKSFTLSSENEPSSPLKSFIFIVIEYKSIFDFNIKLQTLQNFIEGTDVSARLLGSDLAQAMIILRNNHPLTLLLPFH